MQKALWEIHINSRQYVEHLALALEQPAQSACDRISPAPIWHGVQDLACQLLGKEHEPLGLAATMGPEASGSFFCQGRRGHVLSHKSDGPFEGAEGSGVC